MYLNLCIYYRVYIFQIASASKLLGQIFSGEKLEERVTIEHGPGTTSFVYDCTGYTILLLLNHGIVKNH